MCENFFFFDNYDIDNIQRREPYLTSVRTFRDIIGISDLERIKARPSAE